MMNENILIALPVDGIGRSEMFLRIEGFSNVLLQEMSQNKKVVSTLCAGDIDKIDGLFTCRPNDEQDLLRAMRQCLEADTAGNRVLFDKELQGRSIDGFIDKVNSYLA
jgi:hypothetical protein